MAGSTGSKFARQNFSKSHGERTKTLYHKAYELWRLFLHNPNQNGKVAVLVEHNQTWQAFLTDEDQRQWPIDFSAIPAVNIKHVRHVRTEAEQADDDKVIKQAQALGGSAAQQAVDLFNNDSDDDDALQISESAPEHSHLLTGMEAQQPHVSGTLALPRGIDKGRSPSPAAIKEMQQEDTTCAMSDIQRPLIDLSEQLDTSRWEARTPPATRFSTPPPSLEASPTPNRGIYTSPSDRVTKSGAKRQFYFQRRSGARLGTRSCNSQDSKSK